MFSLPARDALIIVGCDGFLEPENVEPSIAWELDRLVRAIAQLASTRSLKSGRSLADAFGRVPHPRASHATDLIFTARAPSFDVLFHLLLELFQAFAFFRVTTGDVRRHAVAKAAQQLVERQTRPFGRANCPQPMSMALIGAGGEPAAANDLWHHILCHSRSTSIDLAIRSCLRVRSCLAIRPVRPANTGDVFIGFNLTMPKPEWV